jgi:hypothetical protein
VFIILSILLELAKAVYEAVKGFSLKKTSNVSSKSGVKIGKLKSSKIKKFKNNKSGSSGDSLSDIGLVPDQALRES